MTPQQLETLVRSADLDGTVKALLAATPAQRREARDTARKLRRLGWELGFQQLPVAQVALLGTGTWTHVQRLRPGGPMGLVLGADAWLAIARLLLGLRPKWAGRWIQARLDDDDSSVPFGVVYRLQREGLYELGEDAAGYVRAFCRSARMAVPENVAAQLREAPELVEVGLFGIFVHDTQLRAEFSRLPAVCAHLASEGIAARARLLDEALQAPLRGLPVSEDKAFLQVYEALQPSAAEDLQRLDWLIELLGSDQTATVGWALGRLKPLVRANDVPMAAFAPALARVLRLPVKGHPKTALRLAERIHRYDPQPDELCRALLAGLHHPAADVVAAALDLMEEHADESVLDELEAAEVPASQRPRVHALIARLGGSVHDGPTDSVDWSCVDDAPDWLRLEALRQGRLEPVALAPLRLQDPVAPVQSLDELLDTLSAELETPSALGLERLLDGVARMADARPGARLEPLLARVAQMEMAHTGPGVGVLAELCWLLSSWAGQASTRGTAHMAYGPCLFLSARTDEVVALMRTSRPRQLLATPTHARGLIDPGVYVERLLACPEHGVADRMQAMLRLAEQGRADALERLSGTRWAREPEALALGAELPLREGPLWLAAARTTDPDGDFSQTFGALSFADGAAAPSLRLAVNRRANWRGAGVEEARIEVQPPRPRLPSALPEPQALWPTVSLHQPIGGGDGAYMWVEPATVQATALTWPHRLRGLFAAAVSPVDLRRDMPPSSWSALTPFLEPMLGYPGPYDLGCCVLLAIALTHKDGGLRGLAVDVLLDAVHAGRIAGQELGQAMSLLHAEGRMSLPRLGAVLGEVVQLGPLEAWVACTIGLCVLQGMEEAPRDLHALLEPLREGMQGLGRPLPDGARPVLEGLSGRSKTARLARVLLGIEGDGTLPGEVVAAAVAGRTAIV